MAGYINEALDYYFFLADEDEGLVIQNEVPIRALRQCPVQILEYDIAV